jgi:HTH-type transcriptional regulator, transcriptional repressor of NAD biosynthesis genes
MDKKYKNSLVLGKFAPPHRGHLYLIDTALENSEVVHVVLCHNSTQNIPGKIRFETLNKIYGDKIKLYLLDDTGLPQSDIGWNKDEFYALWVPTVYKLIDKLDAVFTSEDYGDDFAHYLGVEHFLVDKERTKYPVSGTKIRTEPFNYWKFIPDQIKPYFIKRIAIMGPESVGKSTMTKYLANYFQTNFVIEYGRLVYESNGNKIELKDFIPISKGRQEIEDWIIKSSNRLLFCDTEDITTYIFSKMYFPEEYQTIEPWLLNTINSKAPYDLYILLKPDIRGVQDGTRNFLKERESHYEVIKSELMNRNLNFVEVGGDFESRNSQCVQIIKSTFNI